MSTPSIIIEKSSAADLKPTNPTTYRSIVGALQYLTLTRPDIIHAINQVCQHFNAPTIIHFKAVKRILRYLKGTQDFGLMGKLSYNKGSTISFCTLLRANCISWCSKKQPTDSRSSLEAEYRSMAFITTEITWFSHILKDLGISLH